MQRTTIKTNQWAHLAAAAALPILANWPAQADDIEIYLGAGNQTSSLLPNVMFIMDTSGSMDAKDDTGQTRLARVQEALKQVLRTTNNVNVGLMRFTDPGGPVLYPVRYIDDPADPSVRSSVNQGSGDVIEVSGTTSSDVNTNDDTITLSPPITDTEYWAGFTIPDIRVPQGATITSAKLRLFSGEASSDTAALALYFEKPANGQAEPFISGSDLAAGAPSQRPRTTAGVTWTTGTWPAAEQPVVSPDLSAALQELTDTTEWCGGNTLNVLVKNTAGTRKLLTYDQSPQFAPQLTVEYDHDGSVGTGCMGQSLQWQVANQNDNVEEDDNGKNDTDDTLKINSSKNNWIGVRFAGIKIPNGAQIIDAELILTSEDGDENNSGSIDIFAELSDDALPFTESNNPVSSRTQLAQPVRWTASGWQEDKSYSRSITPLVQELVERTGWASGNAMAFHLKPVSGSVYVESYVGSKSKAPKLRITYKSTGVSAAVTTVRDKLIESVDLLTHKGWTPIVDTLYESALYFSGGEVHYGLKRGDSNTDSTVRQLTRVSHRDSYDGLDPVRPSGCTEDNLSSSSCIGEAIPSGATYISPITDTCQGNHVVLLTDGKANHLKDKSLIEAMIGGQGCVDEESSGSGEKCGVALARYLNETGLPVGGNTALMGKLTTHTIGFDLNDATIDAYLKGMAEVSGGSFYTADNADGLVNAFETILREALDVNTTFVNPGVAVNQFNRLNHTDEQFYAIFHPEQRINWPGNLKKYKINGNTVVGQGNKAAIDSATGQFKDTVQDYWSDKATDNRSVKTGGAANRLPTSRRILSDLGTNQTLVDISSGSYDDLLDESVLDQSDANYRTKLIQWLKGLDEDGNQRFEMGDPLHSQPVAVDYPVKDGNGKITDWDTYIFVATNQGYLHAIHADTGAEKFAFIPAQLMSNSHQFFQNYVSFTEHVYGLDGDLVVHNHKGATPDEDKKYLYIGMRRGGSSYISTRRDGGSYFALDITDIDDPRFVFEINSDKAGYEKLGQTWSRPVFTKVRLGDNIKDVMIFGGGYDTIHDDASLKQKQREDDKGNQSFIGNAVYMADAKTGELLWVASNQAPASTVTHPNYSVQEELNFSVAAKIAVIDRDKDGLADHLYVADLGGQVHRMDIHHGKSGTKFVTARRLAKLTDKNKLEDGRRLYYAPDVARVNQGNQTGYFVVVGSGFRARPLDTQTQDMLFVIKDWGVFQPEIDENQQVGYQINPVTWEQLHDTTDYAYLDDLESLSTDEREKRYKGYYIRLTTEGEKALSPPMVLNHRILFTTYMPGTAQSNSCTPPEGSGRLYMIQLASGEAVADIDGVADDDGKAITPEDRSTYLDRGGIPPAPRVLFTTSNDPIVCIGTECAQATHQVGEDGNRITQQDNTLARLLEELFGTTNRVVRGSSWKSNTEVEVVSK